MARPITVDLLTHAPLFARLPQPLLDDVAAASSLIARPKGARIFEEGSASDSCYLLTAGRAKVVMSGPNGAEITIAILQPYALVGEVSLIDGLPRSAGLAALDDCRLVHIPGRAFQALRRHREFDAMLLVHVTSTLRRATDQLRAIYTFDSVERVAWSVAQMAMAKGLPAGREIAIRPRPSHRELAELTGSSRETVSRALLRLRTMRWLRWDRGAFYMDVKAARRYMPTAHAVEHADEAARVGLRAV